MNLALTGLLSAAQEAMLAWPQARAEWWHATPPALVLPGGTAEWAVWPLRVTQSASDPAHGDHRLRRRRPSCTALAAALEGRRPGATLVFEQQQRLNKRRGKQSRQALNRRGAPGAAGEPGGRVVTHQSPVPSPGTPADAGEAGGLP